MLNPINFVKWAFSPSEGRGYLAEETVKGFAKATVIGTGGTLISLALSKMDLLSQGLTTVATYGFGAMALVGIGVPAAVAGVLIGKEIVKKGIPALADSAANIARAPVNFGKWLITPPKGSNVQGAGLINYALKMIGRVVTATTAGAATSFVLGKTGVISEFAASVGTWTFGAMAVASIAIPVAVLVIAARRHA